MQWLNTTVEFLSPGWVGSLIGLVGIAAAAITYFLTRQRTRLSFRYTGERLLGLSIDGLPPGITVQYRGDDIARLTRTLLVFWNAGEKTILGGDVITSDPLRLLFPDDCRVLTASVLKETRAVSETKTTLDAERPNEVHLHFSFLDPADGAVVEVLHTSEARYPKFVGTVRGLPDGLRNLGRIPRPRQMRKVIPLLGSPRKLGWLTTVLGFLFAGAGLFVPWEKLAKVDAEGATSSLAIVGAGFLYALLGLTLIFLSRRRHPKALHMDELE